MAYARTNFKTKKALKDAVAKGRKEGVFQPNAMFPSAETPQDGTVYLEGPHYPAAHTWYAQVELKGGYIVRVK